MRDALLRVLVDPISGVPLQLAEGCLRSRERDYPIVNGIPRFVTSSDAGQEQTKASFAFIDFTHLARSQISFRL